jgi:hypothetical protein
MEIVVPALGAIMFGGVLGYAGWCLFAEYRKAFFADPRAVMTLDVMVQIVKCGIGPVYLSALCLIAAVAFIFGGIAILLAEALHALRLI